MIDKKGFTLIELTMVLGVFAILMLAGTDFFVTAVRNNNRSVIENEVRQNTNRLLQDVTTEIRKSSCIYTQAPSIDTFLLRLADDRNSPVCAVGNTVEYFQTPSGVVTKAATSSSGIQTGFGVFTSNSIAVLDCSAPNSPCGTASCTSGITTNPSGLVSQNTPLTINIRAQQKRDRTRPDFCAAIKLTDTVTPRVY